MLPQPPLWLTLVAFLCLLGPIVFVHELGHYLVARAFRIPAEAFSIGFGREIIGWTDKQNTRWKVGWLPLGGYVRFIGNMSPASNPVEESEIPPELRDSAFPLRPVWQRFLVVLAGPIASFVLGIAIIAFFIGIYGAASTPNLVVGTLPGSAARAAGLQVGDRIVSIAGRSTPHFEEISQLTSLYPDQEVKLEVLRNGRTFEKDVRLGHQVVKDGFGQSYKFGLLGLPVPQRQFERVPAARVLPLAIQRSFFLTRTMAEGVWQILSGRRSVKDLGGPITIAKVAGQQASLGLEDFIGLVALLSINLGFINLLPVPMLDGGHLFFYTVEAVQRRPVSAKALDWAFRGGLALIFALMVFLTVNDLGSLGLWDRLQRLIG